MSNATTAKFQPIPRAVRVSALIGSTAWAVLLGGSVAVSGEPLLGLKLGALGAVVGLGLGQLCLLAAEASDHAGGGPGQRLRVLWGALFFSVGIMTMLLTAIIMPALADHPDSTELLRAAGGGTTLPLWACFGLCAIGAILLSMPLRPRDDESLG